MRLPRLLQLVYCGCRNIYSCYGRSTQASVHRELRRLRSRHRCAAVWVLLYGPQKKKYFCSATNFTFFSASQLFMFIQTWDELFWTLSFFLNMLYKETVWSKSIGTLSGFVWSLFCKMQDLQKACKHFNNKQAWSQPKLLMISCKTAEKNFCSAQTWAAVFFRQPLCLGMHWILPSPF